MHETAANSPAPWRRVLAVSLGIVVLSGSLAAGQQPGGKPKSKPAATTTARSLEDLLAAGLKNNPDIRVAEAKLREAEAELNRTRLQTTQKIVTLHRGLEAQQAVVESAEVETHRLTQLYKSGTSPAGGVETARQKALQAKAKLSEIEAEIAYLTGQQPAGQAGTADANRELQAFERAYSIAASLSQARTAEAATAATVVKGMMAHKIRKALDTPVRVEHRGTSLPIILEHFQEKIGIQIVVNVAEGFQSKTAQISFPDPVPLGAALQALEDTFSVRCYVRQYGLLFSSSKENPPGAVLLHEFWKGSSESDKLKPAPKAEKK